MSTHVSEITTLSELMEKVEEYALTTSHLMIAHPGIDEITWEIPSLPVELVKEAAQSCGSYPCNTFYQTIAFVFNRPGCYIHAVSVPVE